VQRCVNGILSTKLQRWGGSDLSHCLQIFIAVQFRKLANPFCAGKPMNAGYGNLPSQTREVCGTGCKLDFCPSVVPFRIFEIDLILCHTNSGKGESWMSIAVLEEIMPFTRTQHYCKLVFRKQTSYFDSPTKVPQVP